MATATENQTGDSINPSKLLYTVIDTYFELEETALSTVDKEFQDKLDTALDLLQKISEFIESLDLYSDNETLTDVTTESLKYFLLPALWSCLTLKRDPNSYANRQKKVTRLDIVSLAERNFDLFLRRVRNYKASDVPLDGILNDLEAKLYDLTKPPADQDKQIVSTHDRDTRELEIAASNRMNKIQRYRAAKELKDKVSYLRTKIRNSTSTNPDDGDSTSVDEDTLRDFYTTLIGHFVYVSLDELESLDRERPILKMMADRQKNGSSGPEIRPPPPPRSNKQMPFIITKDAVQKQVFGLGYPAVPVMSIDEFISSKLADGTFAGPGGTAGVYSEEAQGHSLQRWATDPEGAKQEEEGEEAEQEDKRERDDEMELARQRAMDDWKDENPRGAGNRYNRS